MGSGIFGLPQNMAAGASAGAILLGWLITGVGMLALALVYQAVALRSERRSRTFGNQAVRPSASGASWE